MIQKYNNYLVQGRYTASVNGDSVLIIGDDDILVAKLDSAADLLSYLAKEGCTGVFEEDGTIKVKFEKENL